jgi:hypothetical protein
MHRAGAEPFTNSEGMETFDQGGSFEMRYQRYRRYNESRDPLPYTGEFERELGKIPGVLR